ncbi:Uncharacterized protein TPAR_08580 [Tolypocladium paradoxum]|uniref:Transcription factor domain-containing protein n=1 Tax=Tolypocladium paradoxum TaxID=94208 RepID=A0A2S4KLZ6_9HYPO|nr:Uncharacterized protein TPAR_08580 [Tolypocladium paradoxum]
MQQDQRQHEGQQQRQRPNVNSQGSQQQFPFSSNEASSSLGENVATRDLRSDAAPEFEANMRALMEPGRGAASSNPMALSSIQQLQHNPLPSSASNISLADWSMGSPHARQNIPNQLLALGNSAMSSDWFMTASENGEATPDCQRNELWPAGIPFIPADASISAQLDDGAAGNAMAGDANGNPNFDLLGSLGIPTPNRILPAPNSQELPVPTTGDTSASTPGFGMTVAPPTGNLAASDPKSSSSAEEDDGTRETLHEAVKKTYGEASLPVVAMRRNFEANERQRSCPFHKLNTDDDNVRIVGGYPRTMTRPGMYPPFVHHKLYRCATGEISEPLARAFSCVGAFYASVPTSETFVYSFINQECRRLVRGFHEWPGSDIDMLAVIHAMCIYQILGFFVSSNPAQARQAELHHVYFLKMTRQLIRQYLQSATRTGEESEEVNWGRWIMNETIRRTVFLVNTINTLSCRIQKQNPYYFEPLDDNLVRILPLPAPEAVWKASSFEEWMAAKAQLTPEVTERSRLTLQQVIDQFSVDSDDGAFQSTGRLQQPRNGTCRVPYEQLDGFTRLVIATVGRT